ncbi:MAG: DnaJ domain-containing protein, partial [Candidatus Nanopelagicales bacterium]
MSAQREWFDTDYYAVLGVDKGADHRELTKAYRRLARELHPGKVFANEDLQVRKALVVLELLVVLGLDVLDEPGFHEQGVDFA